MNFIKKIVHPFRMQQVNQYAHQKELLSSLLVMAWVVEARDPYTGGHLWRVSRFANLLAQALSLPEADIARITLGGFLHDLGKVGVPDNILGKKDKLTDAEYNVMQTHPNSGWNMISNHPLAWVAASAIKYHHERPDGKGYPFGLSHNEIPIDARIVSICDAFDAMTSTRPYREGMPVDKALSIIKGNLGIQFDEKVGSTFIEIARNSLLDHIIGHSEDGIPLQHCMMCGPTLVIRADQKSGDSVYCPSCMGEYALIKNENEINIVATGDMGTPEDVTTKPDTRLIDTIVEQVIPALGNKLV